MKTEIFIKIRTFVKQLNVTFKMSIKITIFMNKINFDQNPHCSKIETWTKYFVKNRNFD